MVSGWGHEDKLGKVGEEGEKIGGDDTEAGNKTKLMTVQDMGGFMERGEGQSPEIG